jgi:protease II
VHQKRANVTNFSNNNTSTFYITVEDGQKNKNKLLLQHFGEQTQAKKLVFMEKYASKHV